MRLFEYILTMISINSNGNIVRVEMDGRWSREKEGKLQDNISEQTMPLPPPPSYAEIQPSFCVPKQVCSSHFIDLEIKTTN